METVKVVIGAGFGDEGKGLMTDYFANEAKKLNKSCLVVCHNGGAQRGHTVTTSTGIRHVFHHFGSGIFAGADTYLSEEFIVNPMVFVQEYKELESLGYCPKVYIHHDCKFSTPFDMILNQIIEESRGDNKHGSCGMGIWETIVRNNTQSYTVSYDRLLRSVLKDIRDVYMNKRLSEFENIHISDEWEDVINDDGLIDHYIDDFMFMMNKVTLCDDSVLDSYNTVIFEGAQGLLLDQNRIEYGDNITPSNTGGINPAKIIGNKDVDVELCYVTRTYMTRHGEGRFDTECSKKDINADMVDMTNIPNAFQGTLRYGYLDYDELYKRIMYDYILSWNYNIVKEITLAVTHCNEYPADKNKINDLFSRVYYSDGMTCNNITEQNYIEE